jgi:hypothetical protein
MMRFKLTMIATILCLSLMMVFGQIGAVHAASPDSSCAPDQTDTTTSNFNGSSIAAGNYVWFNAVLSIGKPSSDTTVYFTSQQIVITPQSGSPITLNPPDAQVQYSTTATQPSTSAAWTTVVPDTNQFAGTGNQFLSGFAYQVPGSPALAGASVSWTGTFSISSLGTGTVSVNWKYGAAVYNSHFMDGGYGGLGVKPTDAQSTQYPNSDHAGTPESQLSNFVGNGAQGGGGSNYTGSYGSSGGPCVAIFTIPENAIFLVFLAPLIPLVLRRRNKRSRIQTA